MKQSITRKLYTELPIFSPKTGQRVKVKVHIELPLEIDEKISSDGMTEILTETTAAAFFNILEVLGIDSNETKSPMLTSASPKTIAIYSEATSIVEDHDRNDEIIGEIKK